MTPTYSTLVVVGLSLAWKVYNSYQWRRDNPRGLPLPPGPKGYPLIDNLLDFPSYKPWLVYDEWSKIYGDMIYFKVLGQPFLVFNSLRTYEIFEKRSTNYSSRAYSPMLWEFLGHTWNVVIMPYGERWRRYRRTFHDFFHPNIVPQYYPIQVDSSRELLRRLLKSPDDFMGHIRYSFASTIMKITYGITIQGDNDALLITAEHAITSAADAVSPGAFLVDLFPVIKYIPEWIPGAGWKKKAKHWRQLQELFLNKPFDITRDQVKDGSATTSIAATLISEKLLDDGSPGRAEQELMFRGICAVAYAGGADTTTSTVQSLFLAMCLYPDVQKKAQAELDLVLDGRLPEFNDRPNLPYINAIVKESMRWQQVLPLGVPHMSLEADEYGGFYIPKGTIVIGNTWSLLHDPEVYLEPLRYNPDRFLKDGKIDPTVRDPDTAAFGFGRRICPGQFLSNNSLFILAAHVLAVFDIRPGLDKDGMEIEIQPEMTNGLLSFPKPFQCRITPRSNLAEELIRNSDSTN